MMHPGFTDNTSVCNCSAKYIPYEENSKLCLFFIVFVPHLVILHTIDGTFKELFSNLSYKYKATGPTRLYTILIFNISTNGTFPPKLKTLTFINSVDILKRFDR